MVGCRLTLRCNDILWENMLVGLLLPQLSTKTSKQIKKRTFLCSGHAGVDAEAEKATELLVVGGLHTFKEI